MSQKIVYSNDDGSAALCIPTPDALTRYTIDEIAVKDVPKGKSYFLVDDKDIPKELQESWVLDFAAEKILVDIDKLLQAKRNQASLTRIEFMLALEENGLYDAAEAAVESGQVTKAAKIMWHNASTFTRMDTILIEFANALGYTDAQLDNIFKIEE